MPTKKKPSGRVQIQLDSKYGWYIFRPQDKHYLLNTGQWRHWCDYLGFYLTYAVALAHAKKHGCKIIGNPAAPKKPRARHPTPTKAKPAKPVPMAPFPGYVLTKKSDGCVVDEYVSHAPYPGPQISTRSARVLVTELGHHPSDAVIEKVRAYCDRVLGVVPAGTEAGRIKRGTCVDILAMLPKKKENP